MNEAAVVSLFVRVRVLLVGGSVTLLSVQVARVALGQAPEVGSFVWWAIA